MAEDKFREQFNKDYLPFFTKYFSLQKFEERIPSYEWVVTQLSKLDKDVTEKEFQKAITQKELLGNSKIKELCRKGVPLKHLKELVFKLLRVHYAKNEYETHIKKVFKGRSLEKLGTFIPLFTNKSFEDSLPVHYLNDEGLTVLKEIMWLLNAYLPSIDYCPLLVKISSFLLIFFEKEETYEIMRVLIAHNIDPEEINQIRWHFTYDYSDNMKIGSSLLASIVDLAEQDTKYKLGCIDTFGGNKERFIQNICESFFLDYLNFYGVIRFLPFFLNEGTKSIYRLTHAMLKKVIFKLEKTLPEEEVYKTFKERTKLILEVNDMFTYSYKINLTRRNNQYKNQADIANIQQKMRNFYYLSSFSPESKILTDNEIVEIWSKLPSEVKIYDCKELYDTESSPEATLSTIYDLCSGYNDDNFLLILIQTENDEVFGGISSKNFVVNERFDYITPLHSVLIKARPNVEVHEYYRREKEILLFEPGAIRFGYSDDGAAFTIAHNLKEGWTEKASVFGDCQLLKDPESDGHFKVKRMEIYLMI